MLLPSYNPATGEIVGHVPLTPVDEIPAVVARARAAGPTWRALGAAGRAAALRGIGPEILRRADALGALLCAEMGKPLREAVGEVRSCASGLDAELAEMVDALQPESLQDAHTATQLTREPFGVCAAITPWNFPFSMPHWMILPALVAGNTVVFKPSEETPLIGAAYAEILQAVLPDGVLQVVHGAGDVGRALVAAPVDLVAFTGSRDAGAHILAAGAPRLQRVILELGGKDPLIVLPGADLAAAARFAVRNAFRNAGQVCVSTERVLVGAAQAAELTARIIEGAAALKVGPGAEAGVEIGPMIHARQKAKVLAQIDDAVAKGATLAYAHPMREGSFLGPVVVTGVRPGMALFDEETFGPVAAITVVEGEEEAVRLANASRYGLGAAVFGGAEEAARVAAQLEAGMVGINRGCGGATGSPWVGWKESGYGFHSGRDGHRQFAQVKIVSRAR